MSYLEKLLDGAEVEWLPIGDVTTSISAGGDLPKKYSKGQTGPTEEFPYPIYSNGIDEKSIYGYTDSYRVDSEAVTISARGTIGWHTIRQAKFTPIVRLIILIPNTDIVTSKFLNYILDITEIGHSGGSIPQLTVPNLKKIQIPIPCPDNPKKSLAIQAEIVRILDAFTSLTAELTAELTMRKKQYNYYRDQLLTFSEDEVEWKSLGEVAMYSKTRIGFDQLDKKNYVGVDNLLRNRAGKVESNYVPTIGNLTKYCEGDILIGNIRPYLEKIWHADCTGGTNGDVLVVQVTDKKVSSRYLYQVLANNKFFEYNMQHSKGAKMPRGDKSKIMGYKVPIPKIKAEQEHIATILDKFDALTNSITEGLPREIELRQKQYEYYRDQLLNFPKPAEAAA